MAKSKEPKDESPKVKVRVKGTQPLSEDGTLRQPKRTEPDGKGGLKTIAADEFETTADRAAALGDSVEIVAG